ncbi:hypothetical protein ABZ383_26495 [Streptomyces sp. NPDC005900]|uniref:hypothetical protein n=1 Tax=Streptomyces sp. NPDC005900 TaxID=3154569 RepID=UPI0034032262
MTQHVDEDAIWRAPDGTHYEILTVNTDGLYYLRRVRQDPDTRQWSIDDNDGIEVIDVQTDVLLREYTAMQREPLPEPRITRLAALIQDLLASYEEVTGHPPAMAEEIRSALGDVERIPAEAQRRQSAARAAYARGHYAARRRR